MIEKKEHYEKAKAEVIYFTQTDIIRCSPGDQCPFNPCDPHGHWRFDEEIHQWIWEIIG